MAYIRVNRVDDVEDLSMIFGSRLTKVFTYGPAQMGGSLTVWEVPVEVPTARVMIRQLGKAKLRAYHVFSESSLPVFLAQRVMSRRGAKDRTHCHANVRAEPGYEKTVLGALYKALLLWQERRMREYRAMARYVFEGVFPVIQRLEAGHYYRVTFPPHRLPKRNGRGTFEVSAYQAPPRPDLAIPHKEVIDISVANDRFWERVGLDERMEAVHNYFEHHSHPTVSDMYVALSRNGRLRGSWLTRYRFYTSAAEQFGMEWYRNPKINMGRGRSPGEDRRRSKTMKFGRRRIREDFS